MCESIRERIQELNENAIFVEDLDEAIVGMTERESCVFVPLYDIAKCAELIMKQHNLDYDEAMEHLYMNIIQAYLGENTPVFATMFPESF